MAPRDEVIPGGPLRERLGRLEGWHGNTSGISKDYRIDYDTAIAIVGEIGKAAAELEHRPDIDIRWDRLHVFLTTHTAGDVVTELDFLLAARIDAISASHGARPVLSLQRVPTRTVPRWQKLAGHRPVRAKLLIAACPTRSVPSR